jgi:hypothetical protein
MLQISLEEKHSHLTLYLPDWLLTFRISRVYLPLNYGVLWKLDLRNVYLYSFWSLNEFNSIHDQNDNCILMIIRIISMSQVPLLDFKFVFHIHVESKRHLKFSSEVKHPILHFQTFPVTFPTPTDRNFISTVVKRKGNVVLKGTTFYSCNHF